MNTWTEYFLYHPESLAEMEEDDHYDEDAIICWARRKLISRGWMVGQVEAGTDIYVELFKEPGQECKDAFGGETLLECYLVAIRATENK